MPSLRMGSSVCHCEAIRPWQSASPVLFLMFSNGNLKTPQFLHFFIFSFFHFRPRRRGYGFFDSAALPLRLRSGQGRMTGGELVPTGGRCGDWCGLRAANDRPYSACAAAEAVSFCELPDIQDPVDFNEAVIFQFQQTVGLIDAAEGNGFRPVGSAQL